MGSTLWRATRDLDPAGDALISSKTFTTARDDDDQRRNREWALAQGIGRRDKKAVARHFVAVSTNAEGFRSSASTPRTCSGSGDWVGGRSARWTRDRAFDDAGDRPEKFGEMLAGAFTRWMSTSARRRRFEHAGADGAAQRLVRQFLRCGDDGGLALRAVNLKRFPAHLQQLTME